MGGRATVGNWEEELERVLWFVGNEGLGVGGLGAWCGGRRNKKRDDGSGLAVKGLGDGQ